MGTSREIELTVGALGRQQVAFRASRERGTAELGLLFSDVS